ncbi:MAG: class I SAM-dependent methyltransferase family protein [bacterium]|nr:class I SAM-dependent methyltransferase family protein [bacterium]
MKASELGLPRGVSLQVLGNVLVVRAKTLSAEQRSKIIELARQLGLKAAVLVYGIESEERKPRAEFLYGNEAKTVHEEAGVKYVVDPTKVMFSRLNKKERERMARTGNRHEIVVDMFAGIGYFSLPIAKNVKRVYALDINPAAIELLIEAMKLNSLLNIVPAVCDNRKILLENIADRIIMGYLFSTEQYLPAAARMAKNTCIVHFHRIFTVEEKGKIKDLVCSWFLQYFKDAVVLEIRKIKNYAPKKIHYVVDVLAEK